MKNEISIDCVIFGVDQGDLKILLIKRNEVPQKGIMALPGDFLNTKESLKASAEKTLKLITGLDDIFLEQIGAFGEVERYPLARVVTIGYYALINILNNKTQAGHTAEKLEWCSVNKLPPLAFDHEKIIQSAYQILKRKIRFEPIGFNLLPKEFSLTELQEVYEAVLGNKLNKRNFRTKISQMKLLINTEKKQQNVAHKPAILYRFDEKVYEDLKSKGFYFNL